MLISPRHPVPHHIATTVAFVGYPCDDFSAFFLPVKRHKLSHKKNWVVVGRTETNRAPVYGERRLLRYNLTQRQAEQTALELQNVKRIGGRYFRNIRAVPENAVASLVANETA